MATFSLGPRSVVNITGGTFNQVNDNRQAQSLLTPWDRLQSAVAPAALHNSAERFDPPRCHPNTRLAVINELRDLALRRGGAGSARILWLSGPAGAGKSAIAQSFCEECSSTNLLLASFFFNRSDPTRNNPQSFVATLAYQIYRKVPAYHQSLILGVIESDPLVFRKSVDAQFRALITDPLRDLFATNYFTKNTPALIIVDGLDECLTAQVQISILTALQNVTNLQPSPFVFIIASRPEHDIQMFFRHSDLDGLLYRLTLDDSYRPDVDIELFLREKIQETRMTHPLTNSIPREWPSSQAIRTLVRKSSGQFIYASVIIKYVTSNRHYPPDRLDVVLQLRPPKRDLPFAELDALYSHIFSCVEDIGLVLRVLCIVLLFHERQVDILTKDIEELCELDRGECLSALCDLQSVLRVESTIHGQQSIRLLHKSLPDYLQDPARSQDYHINTTPKVIIPILTHCLRCISDLKLDYNVRYSSFIMGHLGLLVSNIRLCHEDLMSFSLINCRTTYHGIEPAWDGSWLREKLLWFAFEFLDKLCTLEGADYERVYHHHLHQFPKLVDQFPEVYGSNSQENRDCIFPMIVIFILLGDSDTQISPKVFDLFHGRLSDVTLVQSPTSGLENLSCSAARRCINSLMHESTSKSAAFALECLPLILPDSKLSPDLNEAHLLGSPFAYTTTEGLELPKLARRASIAMHEYRNRYAMVQPAIMDSYSRPWLLYEYRDQYAMAEPTVMDSHSRPLLSQFIWPGDWAKETTEQVSAAFNKSKDIARLKASIENFDLTVEQCRKNEDPSLPTTLTDYAVFVWRYYQDFSQSRDDLDKVIRLGTEAQESWSGDKNSEPYAILLNTLATVYFEQYKRAFGQSPINPDKTQKAFDNAFKYFTELKDNPAAEERQRALGTSLIDCAVAAWRHYAHCGQSPEDLDKVLCISTKAWDSWAGEKNVKPYAILLITLIAAYFEKYKRAFGPSPINSEEKQKAFDNAFKYFTELKDNPAAKSQRRALGRTLINCAIAVWRHYADFGQSPEDLDKVIRLSAEAWDSWSGNKNSEHYAILLNTLAAAYFEQYKRAFGPNPINANEKKKAFDSAFMYYIELKDNPTAENQRRALRMTLINCAVAAWRHYARCGQSLEDLDKVICLSTEAWDSWSGEKNVKPYAVLLITLVAANFEQYKRAFGPSPINPDEKQKAFNNAFRYYAELKDNPAAESQRRALRRTLINCAIAVWRNYSDFSQSAEDLDTVICLSTEAWDSWSGNKNSEHYAILLNTLAAAYFEQYKRAFGPNPINPNEKQKAFDSAFIYYTELKDNPAAENQRRALGMTLINCSVAVWRHYTHCGQSPEDLDKVLCLGTEAWDSWSGEKNSKPYTILLNTLAAAYLEQYHRAFGPRPVKPHMKHQAFANAAKYYTKLKDNTAAGSQRSAIQVDLSIIYRIRCKREQTLDSFEIGVQHLKDALSEATEAGRKIDTGNENNKEKQGNKLTVDNIKATCLLHLADSYEVRYMLGKDPQKFHDLTMAIDSNTEAKPLLKELQRPELLGCLFNIGRQLRLRWLQTRDPSDFDTAKKMAEAARDGVDDDDPLKQGIDLLIEALHPESRQGTLGSL